MTAYQILIHGFGFNVSLSEGSGAISGFYTARRVKGDDPDDAYMMALELLKSEEKTKSLIDESITNGGTPRFESEEIFKVPFLSRIFVRCPKGFVFYDDSESSDATSTETQSEQGDDGDQIPL